MAKGNKKQPVKKQYIDLYYMLPKTVGAKEIASAICRSEPEYAERLECWEEAGVLELLIGEEGSIDMEILELSKEELQDEFLQSHQIVAVYSVHTDSAQLEEAKKVFAALIAEFGGLLCSDTRDFMPILVK